MNGPETPHENRQIVLGTRRVTDTPGSDRGPGGERWPEAGAYAMAARDTAEFFVGPELRAASLRRSPIGIPLPATGRNAAVFKATIPSGDIAVRVFTRPPSHGPERYRLIGDHIRPLEGVLFPNVTWVNQGVRVDDRVWPMIRMDWVEGLTLDQWVAANRHDTELMLQFARHWDELFKFLEHSRIAHGDLQNGNVLVDSRHRVRLVDLDGVWIPALADLPADEYGHVHFQHPGRLRDRVWGERMDGFAALLVAVSLVAIAHRPELWDDHHDGGNNLIFGHDDLVDLDAPIWSELVAIDDPVLVARVHKLRRACDADCAKLAGPVSMLDDDEPSPIVPGSPTWLLAALGVPADAASAGTTDGSPTEPAPDVDADPVVAPDPALAADGTLDAPGEGDDADLPDDLAALLDPDSSADVEPAGDPDRPTTLDPAPRPAAASGGAYREWEPAPEAPAASTPAPTSDGVSAWVLVAVVAAIVVLAIVFGQAGR